MAQVGDLGVALPLRLRRPWWEAAYAVLFLVGAGVAWAFAQADGVGVSRGDRWSALTVAVVFGLLGVFAVWSQLRPGAGILVGADGMMRVRQTVTQWVDLGQVAWVYVHPEKSEGLAVPDVIVADRRGRQATFTLWGRSFCPAVAAVVLAGVRAGVPVSGSSKAAAAAMGVTHGELEAHRGRAELPVRCRKRLEPATLTFGLGTAFLLLAGSMMGFGNEVWVFSSITFAVALAIVGATAVAWWFVRRSWLVVERDGMMRWRDGREQGSLDLRSLVAAEAGANRKAYTMEVGGAWWHPPASMKSDDVVGGGPTEMVLHDASGRECALAGSWPYRWLPSGVLAGVLLDHLEAAGVELAPVNRFNLEQAAGRVPRVPPEGAVRV